MCELNLLYWFVSIKLVRWSFWLGLHRLSEWIGEVSGLRFRLEQFIRRQP